MAGNSSPSLVPACQLWKASVLNGHFPVMFDYQRVYHHCPIISPLYHHLCAFKCLLVGFYPTSNSSPSLVPACQLWKASVLNGHFPVMFDYQRVYHHCPIISPLYHHLCAFKCLLVGFYPTSISIKSPSVSQESERSHEIDPMKNPMNNPHSITMKFTLKSHEQSHVSDTIKI